MSTRLNPYLQFQGTAREAMTRYQEVLGGQLDLNSFAEFGGMDVPEAEQQNVMHSQLTANGTVVVMGADVPSHMGEGPLPNGTVSLSGDDETTLKGWWDGLAEGGTVQMPLEKAPWGDHFGQLVDRFGITWMFNIAGQPEG